MKNRKIIILIIVVIIVLALCIGAIYYKKILNNSKIDYTFESFQKYEEHSGSASASYDCTIYSYADEIYLSNYIFDCGESAYIVKKLNDSEKNLLKNAIENMEEVKKDNETLEKKELLVGDSRYYGIYYQDDVSVSVSPINLTKLGIIEDMYDYKTVDCIEIGEELNSIYNEKQFYNFFNNGSAYSQAYVKCLDEQIKSQISENLKSVTIKENKDDSVYTVEIVTESDKLYEGLVTYEGYLLNIIEK